MWLLEASTLNLREFTNEIPAYAIVSHTWSDGEVSFQDMRPGLPVDKPGFQKIVYSCQQALSDRLKFVWIDTCCIDKTDNAALSEAINSMYKWYEKATVCYAYLEDVDDSFPLNNKQFRAARWFTRGWTLQELIAPCRLTFYARNWTFMGDRFSTREKVDLSRIIEEITGIPLHVLRTSDKSSIFNLSVARRMSWASNRQTTRIEDIAYCLLGLFDVNMPMLYGEGDKAFIRLQEEILKISEDHTIFAFGLGFFAHYHEDLSSEDWGFEEWRLLVQNKEYLDTGTSQRSSYHHGFLAESPSDFQESAAAVPHPHEGDTEPYALTNKGLRIRLKCRQLGTLRLAKLDCHLSDDIDFFLAINLGESYNGVTRRVGDFLYSIPRYAEHLFEYCDLYFSRGDFAYETKDKVSFYDHRQEGWLIPKQRHYSIKDVYPASQWDEKSHMIKPPRERPTRESHKTYHAVLELVDSETNRTFLIAVGIGPHSRLVNAVDGINPNSTIARPWCAVLSQCPNVMAAYNSIADDQRRSRLSRRRIFTYPFNHKTAFRCGLGLYYLDERDSREYNISLKVSSAVVFGQEMFTLEVKLPGTDDLCEAGCLDIGDACQCWACPELGNIENVASSRTQKPPWQY